MDSSSLLLTPSPELCRAAERSVARRARIGLLAYPLLTIILGIIAGLRERPGWFLAITLVPLALAAVRVVVVQRFEEIYDKSPRLWSLAFYGSLVVSLIPVSALVPYVLLDQGITPPALIAVTVVAFLAPVAVLVYAIHLAFSRLYLAILILPLVAALLVVQPGSLGSWPAVWVAIYSLYLFQSTSQQHRERWQGLTSAYLLTQRADELEEAHRELSRHQAELEQTVAARTEELWRTGEQYRQIFENAHDAIVIFEPAEERVLNVNRRACEIYGFPRERFIGMSLLPISEDPARGRDQIARTIEKGSFYNFATRQRRADGSMVALEVNAATIEYEGELAILSINRDVTERMRTQELRMAKEAAERADRAKGQFLANMSHEIRTPMAGIMGLADLLAETELSANQKGYAQMIQTSAASLLQLIDDVLDFSKIEAGRLAIESLPFDLPSVLTETVELLHFQARSKGISLSLSLAAELPEWVSGDAGRLRQVTVNLVGNSIKFTDQGGIEVEAVPEAGETIRVTVRDSGIGIPEEVHDRLFSPFSQADGSTSRRYGGTGLGLAISRRIVELMGGQIGFESEPGKGSAFWFRLRLPAVPGPGEAATVSPVAARPEAGAPAVARHVLVAEDNPINQLVVTQQLKVLGYEVTAVSNGVEALEALGGRAFDLVLMDCQMPELDGYETTRRMRAGGGPNGAIPVIALTAHAMKGDRERCFEAGMNDYLTKPFRVEALKGVLERWLDPTS